MKNVVPASPRSLLTLAVVALLVIAGCTGHGGGTLAPDGVLFTDKATLGFSFSCERSSKSTNTNPPTGRLRLNLSYSDHGRSPIGTAFSIHGTADVIEPAIESAVCIGQEPPPGGNELIILGRYRLTNGAPVGFAPTCGRSAAATPCRFELIVRDNDANRAPSAGDFVSIRLSTVTDTSVTQFPAATVFYARAGLLVSGNLTVD
jgi:hypothetical protein